LKRLRERISSGEVEDWPVTADGPALPIASIDSETRDGAAGDVMPSKPASGSWIVVTGLDGAGKTTLVHDLGVFFGARTFRLPFHDFVRPMLLRSGGGEPYGDVHTDRLLFALDARLANYQIASWRKAGEILVSQRGWMDNFIFGSVQGVSHSMTNQLLKTVELEKPTAQIFLIADPKMAFARIEHDPKRDKYETVDFLVRQREETLRFLARLSEGPHEPAAFFKIPTMMIDTSLKTTESVFGEVRDFVAAQLAVHDV
jgi:thymidylate kinase